MAEKKQKREFDPIHPQNPNPDAIRCKDCVYRDKTTIKIGDKVLAVGIAKAFCECYPKENHDGKPLDVLFQGSDCEYYVQEAQQ